MRLLTKVPVVLLLASASFGCHSTTNGDTADSAGAFPRPEHIIIVIEENHGFDQIIGAPEAPYINKLAESGALFTNSHGVTHPSQPNYIAFFSGATQGIKGDKCLADTTPFSTRNLGASLIKAGYTFTGYGETMPSVGFRKCYYQKSSLTKSSLYGRKHCPWVNWLGDHPNGLPDSVSRPMTDFPDDFSKLPTVAFVIPNMDNDMHNHGSDTAMTRRADSWLREHLSAYIRWAEQHNSLFILTFDEDNFTRKNEIPTFFVGPMVKPGKYGDSINHYNVLRTLEKMYQLPPAGSAKAAPIREIWKG